ncbi:YggS family pyridoxal phosphate-dependent enzyme [Proteiniphilum sp. X52]|uniref:YggS family pyridoxal phosphate-dependent enzyme n=1 Tax=Proteiniphilum sp. X52 TaxID=2382159 RepID=UPI000F0A72D1|nr:YggS family pyridoxal phosphate-dependent enzyme [Proteiniphilum sp. X52]RNC66505.1 YggS family pyridoxal phosphate-dependent enzyme [Proteiniphilum sp. X52]
MDNIRTNLSIIHQRMEAACKKANRHAGDVRLLLATKTVPAERIAFALECGERLVGENKVQELKGKYEVLRTYNYESHFIGHLQTNKIKDALKYVTCIESVDRLDLARKLDQRLQFEGRSMDILVQVNSSFEESKFGIDPADAIPFIREVAKYDTLAIRGLMTIGLFSAEEEKVRRCFRLLKNIRQQVIEEDIPNVEMRELSMGMSGDLEIAIEEGATIVRVGTAIFGQRMYPDSYYWNESKR